MKSILLLLILAGISFSVAQAQDVVYFKKNIKELSSPKYGGRGYYNDNDKEAARYIADEFTKAGAKVTFQEITFPINDFNGKVDFLIDGKRLRPGYDYTISTYSASAKGIFKIYNLDTAEFNMDSTMELLKEKGEDWIVVADMTPIAQQLLGRLTSDKIKVGGLIIKMGEKEAMGYSPVMMQKRYSETRTLLFPLLIVDKAAYPANAGQIMLDIEMKLNKEEKSSNVIATIKGSTYPDSIFVFTAHYDHLGMFGTQIFYPGANDNASGTSMLLTLAGYYNKPENKPAQTLVFIATTGEEMGLLGSKKFVDNPPFNLKNIKYVLNFDMIADQTDTLTTTSDTFAMRGYDLMKSINEKEGLFAVMTCEKYQQNGDHYPFLLHKIPAICFMLEKGKNFTLLHTPADNIDHISYSSFPKIFKLVTEFVKQY